MKLMYIYRWELWLLLGAAICVFAVVQFLFSMLSPYGYRGRYVQRYDRHDDQHKDGKSKLNCRQVWWNAVGSVVGGVCHISLY